MESSSVSSAVSASAALSLASTTDASRMQWLRFTHGWCTLWHHVSVFLLWHWSRLFSIAHDAGCRLSNVSIGHIFDACYRLELPLAEIESVYTQHISVGAVDEKFFMMYLRCRLTQSPIKVVSVLQDIILDMAQLSNPLLPFIKLFNVALSFCTSAHEAAQVCIFWRHILACIRFGSDFIPDHAAHRCTWLNSWSLLFQLPYQSLPHRQSMAMCPSTNKRNAILRHSSWHREHIWQLPVDVENLSNQFCRLASILLYTQWV